MRTLSELPHEFSSLLDPSFRGFEIGEGWAGLLFRALTDLQCEAPGARLRVAKEKFGSLRLIVSDRLDPIAAAIARRAEAASACTCEICGEPGRTIRRDNPVRTRCGHHEEVR